MQPTNQQQAYDRAITIFSPDGRLYQVEYAREAVKRGTASVGVATGESAVLLAHRRVSSPLRERDDIEKIVRIDDHVGAASAGHVNDARTLVDVLREQAQRNRAVYEEPIAVPTLVEQLCDEIQDHTQSGGVRPFGVSLLVGGVSDGEPRIFETDPSGSYYEWRASAIGARSGDIRETLEEQYEDGLDTGEGVGIAVEAIREHVEDDVGPEALSAAVVDADDATFAPLDTDELEEYI